MAITHKLKETLDKAKVRYRELRHPLAYDAARTAAAQHVPGEMMAKAVIVKGGDDYVMCVLSALHLVDFEKLGEALGKSQKWELAKEDEIQRLFPDYDRGAEPPFGEGKIPVVLDEFLHEGYQMVFNGGTHTDAVEMSIRDYEAIAQPQVARISRRR